MSRKEVFQAKVLKKLYPSPSLTFDKVSSPPTEPAALQSRPATKSKCKENVGYGQPSALVGKKVYTVLPPPEGFIASIELPQDPFPSQEVNNVDPESEEANDVQEEDQGGPRRKRRRKRGGNPCVASQVPVNTSKQSESNMGSEVHLTPDTVVERLSRNKKRKLKKKRHKEKLRSLGLVPQATAIEFTFQQVEEPEEEEKEEGDEEEKEEEEEKETCGAVKWMEVLEFLKTTLEIYIADCSSTAKVCPDGADTLIGHLVDGTVPSTDLVLLCGLKDLVRRGNLEELRNALEEFKSSTTMSDKDASIVYTLFHYWITDIFPLGNILKT